MTIVYFILTLGILVFIHEFGHFIAAKKQGIGVEKFSLGFGPEIFGVTRGETRYLISALPFGGYVKLMGEDPESAKESGVPKEKNYSARPIWQRFLVVFAGPAMNLLLAAFLMPLVFLIGRMEPKFFDEKPVGVRAGSPGEAVGLQKGDEIAEFDGKAVPTWRDFGEMVSLSGGKTVLIKILRGSDVLVKEVKVEESEETHAGTLGIEPGYFIGNDPVIDEVAPGQPADKAGLKAGDVIVAIDQQPVQTWTEMTDKVEAAKGKPLAVTYRRGTDQQTVTVAPAYDEGAKKWLMGIRKDPSRHTEDFLLKRYGFVDAVKKGMSENLKLGGLTLSVLKRLFSFQLSYKALGGPIRIAQASAMAAKAGLSDFVYFLAFLSIQLGVLNLLPIPVLDGGHFLFFGMEAVLRRPPSAKVRGIAEQAFFFLLISFMLLVTLNDLNSIEAVRNVMGKIRSIF
jgi:regulator of sigma E protease